MFALFPLKSFLFKQPFRHPLHFCLLWYHGLLLRNPSCVRALNHLIIEKNNTVPTQTKIPLKNMDAADALREGIVEWGYHSGQTQMVVAP
jgi:hypothetical protein